MADNKFINLIKDNKWDELIKQLGDDLDKYIISGNGVYHLACLRGNIPVVQKLEKMGIDKYKPNIDGDTGYHLLIRYGFFDNQKLKLDKEILSKINKKNESIADTVINNVNGDNNDKKIVENNVKFLSHIIDLMIRYDILNIFRLPDIMFTYTLAHKVKKNKEYKPVLKKVLGGMKNIDFPKGNPIIIFATRTNNLEALKIMMKFPKNINIKDYRHRNALVWAILNKNDEIAKVLIENGIDLNYGSIEKDEMPLHRSIQFQMFDIADLLIKNGADLNAKDNYHNIPLQWLMALESTQHNAPPDMLRNLIKNSDLTSSNIYGYNSLHLLIKYDLWKEYADILTNKELNVTQLDKHGKNPLAYLKKDDREEFMSLLEKNRVSSGPIEIKRNDIDIMESKETNFGMFNANIFHANIYTMFLLDRHKDIAVPFQQDIASRKHFDLWRHSMLESDANHSSAILHDILEYYIKDFYSLAPYLVIWRDKYINYIHPDIELYLKKVSGKRFILMKLTLLPNISGSSTHANILLFDQDTKTVRRFEPYGISEILDASLLDKKLSKIFKNVFGSDTKFLSPSDYLSDVIFQSASADSSSSNKKLGDPEGYCLAWCIWFVDLKLRNPDLDDKTLVSKAADKIIGKNTTPFLTYIRGYAKTLDNFKNKLLTKLRVRSTEHYDLIPSKDAHQKLYSHIVASLS